MHVPRNESRLICYRRYKHFDEASFKHDLDMAPFYVGNVFDDVDDIFWCNHALNKNIIDGHAPIKYKKSVKQPAPFMHSKLRKACLQKSMLRNKYFKSGRPNHLWERYRKMRDHVLLAMPRVETRGSQNKIKYNLSKEIKALCCDEFSIPNDINIGTNID